MVQILGVMARIAKVAFDVKCLLLSANQDAGTLTKGGYPTSKRAQVTFWSQYCLFCDFDVNDITTYGGGAFKTGTCLGYCILEFDDTPGVVWILSIDSFDEVKKSGRAYYRFKFSSRETVSQQFIA